MESWAYILGGLVETSSCFSPEDQLVLTGFLGMTLMGWLLLPVFGSNQVLMEMIMDKTCSETL